MQEREAGRSGRLPASSCWGRLFGCQNRPGVPRRRPEPARKAGEGCRRVGRGRSGCLQVGLFWGRLPGGDPAPAFHLHLSLVSLALRELRILNTPCKARPTKRKYVFACWAQNWYDTWLQICLFVTKSDSVASGGEVGWGGAGGWVTRRLKESLR